MSYKIPAQTRIGHVHLKVAADLERALKFYRDILGFEVMQYYGDSAVFISAGELSPSYWIEHLVQQEWFSATAALNRLVSYGHTLSYKERPCSRFKEVDRCKISL